MYSVVAGCVRHGLTSSPGGATLAANRACRCPRTTRADRRSTSAQAAWTSIGAWLRGTGGGDGGGVPRSRAADEDVGFFNDGCDARWFCMVS